MTRFLFAQKLIAKNGGGHSGTDIVRDEKYHQDLPWC